MRLGHRVTDISRADGFRVETDKGSFTAAALVLATGGLSIPKMGATGFAYEVARRFGLRVTETLPGLVPLTATPEALGLTESPVGHFARRRSRPAARRVSARTSCSPIAASPARRSCRSRPTGGRARRSRSICCRRTTPKLSQGAQAHAPEGRAEDRAGRNVSRTPRRRLAASLPNGPMANIPDRTLGAFAARLKRWEVTPDRLGRLRQGRGHGRRDRHARPLVQDHAGAQRARASTRSAKPSTSPAGSAAIISSGPGRAAGAPGRALSAEARGRPWMAAGLLAQPRALSRPSCPQDRLLRAFAPRFFA